MIFKRSMFYAESVVAKPIKEDVIYDVNMMYHECSEIMNVISINIEMYGESFISDRLGKLYDILKVKFTKALEWTFTKVFPDVITKPEGSMENCATRTCNKEIRASMISFMKKQKSDGIQHTSEYKNILLKYKPNLNDVYKDGKYIHNAVFSKLHKYSFSNLEDEFIKGMEKDDDINIALSIQTDFLTRMLRGGIGILNAKNQYIHDYITQYLSDGYDDFNVYTHFKTTSVKDALDKVVLLFTMIVDTHRVMGSGNKEAIINSANKILEFMNTQMHNKKTLSLSDFGKNTSLNDSEIDKFFKCGKFEVNFNMQEHILHMDALMLKSQKKLLKGWYSGIIKENLLVEDKTAIDKVRDMVNDDSIPVEYSDIMMFCLFAMNATLRNVMDIQIQINNRLREKMTYYVYCYMVCICKPYGTDIIEGVMR